MKHTPRIKIFCISSTHEAEKAIGAGASVLGLVGRMPSGPGVISDQDIREIAASVPSNVATWLLTSETAADDIIEHYHRVHTTGIQMVDTLQRGNYRQIRESLPGVDLIQVVHVVDEESVEQAVSVSSHVDAVLLDSGNPALDVKELGGTGRIHDWQISKRIRDRIKKPLFLAGGLTPENISRAVHAVNPYGVDICSGVRSNGKLDEEKLNRLVNAVKKHSL
jgi:phosphoribosylanthranilate isomerase